MFLKEYNLSLKQFSMFKVGKMLSATRNFNINSGFYIFTVHVLLLAVAVTVTTHLIIFLPVIELFLPLK